MNRREAILGTAAVLTPTVASSQDITGEWTKQDEVYWRAQWQINQLEGHRAQYQLNEEAEEILDLLLDIDK